VFVLGLVWSAAARAQTSRPDADTYVRVESCSEQLRAELPAVVKLEIDVLLRERGPTRAPPERIVIRCRDERAQIEVTLGGASRESSIDVGQLAAEPRARAVALAAAELVHAMSSQTPAQKAPEPALTQPAPAAARTLEPPRRSLPRPALLAGGVAEWLGKPGTLLWGARLAFHYPLGALVVPALSLDGTSGDFSSRSARITVTTVTAGAHAYFGTTTGRVRWAAGPGARLGWAQLAGQPDAGSVYEGQTLAAAWGGPEARARVAYGMTESGSPLLALEVAAGVVTLPVRGLLDQRESVYALAGPWLSLCAELGLGL
jgi:hypothetical protein